METWTFNEIKILSAYIIARKEVNILKLKKYVNKSEDQLIAFISQFDQAIMNSTNLSDLQKLVVWSLQINLNQILRHRLSKQVMQLKEHNFHTQCFQIYSQMVQN
ncbi:hypothetical protein SS50377_20420 [Spironucleus salmonicida]|uniref:Uncharacterized protein n=1 Tax=Spironucleus salmonicida TaxID=348837 RepID=A0A9P8S1T8_9EUKA|nr:hypothetical protein SS50377_20420 [Spironucleus salmonicida]